MLRRDSPRCGFSPEISDESLLRRRVDGLAAKRNEECRVDALDRGPEVESASRQRRLNRTPVGNCRISEEAVSESEVVTAQVFLVGRPADQGRRDAQALEDLPDPRISLLHCSMTRSDTEGDPPAGQPRCPGPQTERCVARDEGCRERVGCRHAVVVGVVAGGDSEPGGQSAHRREGGEAAVDSLLKQAREEGELPLLGKREDGVEGGSFEGDDQEVGVWRSRKQGADAGSLPQTGKGLSALGGDGDRGDRERHEGDAAPCAVGPPGDRVEQRDVEGDEPQRRHHHRRLDQAVVDPRRQVVGEDGSVKPLTGGGEEERDHERPGQKAPPIRPAATQHQGRRRGRSRPRTRARRPPWTGRPT